MKNLGKKIMSLFMVFAMSASVSYMVSAENVDKEKTGEGAEYIPVTLEATPSYVVNIPAQIILVATKDIQSKEMYVTLLNEEALTNSFAITTRVNGSQDQFKLYYNGDETNGLKLSCDFGVALDYAQPDKYLSKYLSLDSSYFKEADGNGGFNSVKFKLSFKLSALPTEVGTYGAGKNDNGTVKPVSLKLEFNLS